MNSQPSPENRIFLSETAADRSMVPRLPARVRRARNPFDYKLLTPAIGFRCKQSDQKMPAKNKQQNANRNNQYRANSG